MWIYRAADRHSCATPSTTGLAPGCKWICDLCGTGWKTTVSTLDSRRAGHWQKVFKRTARKWLKEVKQNG